MWHSLLFCLFLRSKRGWARKFCDRLWIQLQGIGAFLAKFMIICPFTRIQCLAKRIFDSLPFMYNKLFLKKGLIEVGSSHYYASFGIACVQTVKLFEAQWDFELSEEFGIDDIFLRFTVFEHFSKTYYVLNNWSILMQKAAKRSVKMWPIIFCKSFYINILLYMIGGLSKIPSVHTFGVR